jgi:hypothetical protein
MVFPIGTDAAAECSVEESSTEDNETTADCSKISTVASRWCACMYFISCNKCARSQGGAVLYISLGVVSGAAEEAGAVLGRRQVATRYHLLSESGRNDQ